MSKKKWVICLLMMLLLVPCFCADARANLNSFICYEEEKEGESGSDFITDAIKSIDENTAIQETDRDYMKNFYNSSLTASTESLNLFNPSTIITELLNVFTYLLEIVGLSFTLFVMILYNFSSSSFISGVVGKIISNIEKVVFDWSNPNSWIFKVLIIAAVMGILYQLIKNFTKFRGYKQIMQIVATTILSTSFIIFIGQHGRTIINAVETRTKDMVVETFVFDGQSGNMEINTKENIFSILQKQPFILRHYGVASIEQLAEQSDQTLDEATERVQTLLNDPSQDNAEKEYEDYDNQTICHDPGSAMFVLFISLIELIHRFLMSLAIGILCIAAGAIKLAKELLLWLSIYQLIWWLIKRSHAAQQWFSDRIMWSIFAIAVDILFSTALYFIMQASAVISNTHPLLMIGFDIVFFMLVKFLIKNIGTIMAKIKDNGGEMIQAMITGSPMDVYHKFKQNHKSSNSGNSPTSSGNSPTSSGNSPTSSVNSPTSSGDGSTSDDSNDDGNDTADTNEDLSDSDDSYQEDDDLSDNGENDDDIESNDDTFDDQSTEQALSDEVVDTNDLQKSNQEGEADNTESEDDERSKLENSDEVVDSIPLQTQNQDGEADNMESANDEHSELENQEKLQSHDNENSDNQEKESADDSEPSEEDLSDKNDVLINDIENASNDEDTDTAIVNESKQQPADEGMTESENENTADKAEDLLPQTEDDNLSDLTYEQSKETDTKDKESSELMDDNVSDISNENKEKEQNYPTDETPENDLLNADQNKDTVNDNQTGVKKDVDELSLNAGESNRQEIDAAVNTFELRKDKAHNAAFDEDESST